MAQEHGADNVVHMVGALTRLFRIGLSRGREMIRVSEEFEHVKSYLTIQKARYGEKFDYSLEVQPEVADWLTLRVMLQPLVENAIYHGIKEQRGKGSVWVTAKGQDNVLEMAVTDNGAGMSPERLSQLRAMLQAERPAGETSGFALYNVNERLRLSFGPEWGITIDSAPGQGTTATIRLPRKD